MKRQLQRLLSLAVAVLFAASGYAYDVVVDGIYYDLNETARTASVISGDSYAGSVSIPASITCEGTTYSVTSIGNEAFSGCTDLTSVTIPESVTSIGGWAFYGCTGLTTVTIPESVTSIGWYAFSGCTGLTSVTIPNSVTSIGALAFFGCTGLTAINVAAGNPVFSSVDGVVYSKDKTFIVLFPEGKGGAFAIPESVTSIGDWAFYDCTGLTAVTIPESVTSIGGWAFSGCTGLTSVTIPNSVTSIGALAFFGCTGLTVINVAADNPVFSSVDGVVYSKDKISIVLFPGGKGGAFAIPNSVTSIGNEAFSGCTGLTSVTIPESVTSIGEQAFYGCTGLTSVTIPESVTSIGGWAFSGCTGLTTVTIPESVTSIGNEAFSGCTGLTSVSIPNSVTSIGDKAFSGCTGLTSVTIPESVTSIRREAFSGCTGLTSVTIPNSVTSIGDWAFSGCTGLTRIYMATTTPPNTGEWVLVFDSATKQTATLYVPTGCLSVYGDAYEWGEFLHMEEWDPTGIGGVETEAASPVAVGWYDLNGRRLNAPAKGVHIVRYSDGTTRKVVVK